MPAYAPDRTVFLSCPIEDPLTDLRDGLTRLVAADPEAPVLLVITSEGGSVLDGLALCDHIAILRQGGAIIDCLIEGYALSFGAMVAQYCGHRMCGPSSILMIHGVEWNHFGDNVDHVLLSACIDTITKQQIDILRRRTNKPARWWKRLLATNRCAYFDAGEALKIGLVDEIIGSNVLGGG